MLDNYDSQRDFGDEDDFDLEEEFPYDDLEEDHAFETWIDEQDFVDDGFVDDLP